MFNLMPFVVLWAMLAAVVLAMVVWRKMVASHEDDNIHMLEPVSVSQQQTVLAAKLDRIDRWGKLLTVVTLIFGLILGAAYVYQGWVNASKIME